MRPNEWPVSFLGYDCIVVKERYANNNRTCLDLYIEKTGEPMTTATVNISHLPLKEDEVFIKDYSENEGLLKELIKAEIVSEPQEWISINFVQVARCKLLI